VDGVGGERRGRHVFALRQRRCVAVHAGGGTEDETLATGVAGGEEEVEGAGDIDVVGERWIGDGAWDAGQRGEVEDVADAGNGAPAVVGVAEVAFDEFDVGGEGAEVVAFAGEEVVEDADGFAVADEVLGDVGADESGAAGDEESFQRTVLSLQRTVTGGS